MMAGSGFRGRDGRLHQDNPPNTVRSVNHTGVWLAQVLYCVAYDDSGRDVSSSNLAEAEVNTQAYLDFRAAQEAYLKANGWRWGITATAKGGTVKWNKSDKNGEDFPVWQELGDAVQRQIRRDEMLFASQAH
jgi:hypothetical protein